MQVEGHVLDGRLVLGRQVLDLEDHLFGLVGFFREALGELAADHHADDLIHGHALEGWVATHWPSRNMVISSQSWKISSILWEM